MSKKETTVSRPQVERPDPTAGNEKAGYDKTPPPPPAPVYDKLKPPAKPQKKGS